MHAYLIIHILSECTEASLEHALKSVLSMTAKWVLGSLLACRLFAAQAF